MKNAVISDAVLLDWYKLITGLEELAPSTFGVADYSKTARIQQTTRRDIKEDPNPKCMLLLSKYTHIYHKLTTSFQNKTG